jgi:hypothetical protein
VTAAPVSSVVQVWSMCSLGSDAPIRVSLFLGASVSVMRTKLIMLCGSCVAELLPLPSDSTHTGSLRTLRCEGKEAVFTH